MSAQDPGTREQLGIVYCPTCRQDTMRSDAGRCFFCNQRLLTDAEKRHKWLAKQRHKRTINQIAARATRRCSRCGIQIDDRTPGCRTCTGRHNRRQGDNILWKHGRLTAHGYTYVAATLKLFPDLANLPSSAGGPTPREGGIHSNGHAGRLLVPVKSVSDSTRQPRSANGV